MTWRESQLTSCLPHPLFTPFRIHGDKMHSLGPYDGSDENGLHGGLSGREWLRARFLSDAIPATSRAAGANEFRIGTVRGNIRMDEYSLEGCMYNVKEWPGERKEERDGITEYMWHHSDFKQLAYFFVHRLFDKFVQGKTE